MSRSGHKKRLERKRGWAPNRSVLALAAVLISAVLVLNPGWAQGARDRAVGAAITPSESSLVATHLYEVQVDVVELEAFPNRGGAIEPLGDGLLVATPRGRLALIGPAGQVEYLPQRVPMNESASEKPILWTGFRVADILLHEVGPGEFRLFASHHYFTSDCVEFRVSSTSARIEGAGARVSPAWKTEFVADPCIEADVFNFAHRGGIQAGGRMLMDGPGHLLLVTGDQAVYEWYQEAYPLAPRPEVEAESHLGRLLRIDLASGEVEIVARGFRNPQGLVRDGAGNIWQTEHGPEGGDELNLLKPGLDYGWPHVTHGTQYGSKVWPYNEEQGRHDGYEKPVYAWIPAIGISNLVVSDSVHFPLWQGDFLVASMISRTLYRVRMNEGHVMFVEPMEIGARIRDITQMPDGRIALLADSARILFLQRAPLFCQSDNDVESIYSYDGEAVCIDLGETVAAADSPAIRALGDDHFDNVTVRSLFNLYVHDDRITYVKSHCLESDLENRFFLHLTPVEDGDLDEGSAHLGFNVLDFNADDEGISATRHGDVCLVTRALPGYVIYHLYTGQVIREEGEDGEVTWRGPVWEGSHTFKGASAEAAADAETGGTGAELFGARCGSCHNLAAEHNIGPHLEGIVGRQAGEIAGFEFTDALTGLEIVWTQESLEAYITDPAAFAAGTTMAGVGVSAEEAQLIAAYLASR